MAAPLTSWKEIAQYLEKGVRTVQRWEEQNSLPVRRPNIHNRGVVLAWPTELDAWLEDQSSRTLSPVLLESMQLRRSCRKSIDECRSLKLVLRLTTRETMAQKRKLREQIALLTELCHQPI